MEIQLTASAVKGILTAPASKSVMQRACAVALLRDGETILHHYGTSNDDRAALAIIQQLGAVVTILDDDTLSIHSTGKPAAVDNTVIQCGESGLSLRMFAPVAALSASTVRLEGEGSLLQRPLDFMETVFQTLGVRMHTQDGRLPLELKGPLTPASCKVDGSITSQFLTGLLLAFSVAAQQEAVIEVDHLKSSAYTGLTLKVMEDFGMNLPGQENYHRFTFLPKAPVKQRTPFHYTVEGDWSNAAFFLVAGAIAGNITVKGLDVFTEQADKKILHALQDCGCRLSIQADQIEVSHHRLQPFNFDATGCPDLFPPLAVLAAFCEGTSVIEGVHRLAHKESDRAASLTAELSKIGATVRIQDDKMILSGATVLPDHVIFDGHNDHRIVMAAAIASLRIPGGAVIRGAEAVNKSFPAFFKALEQVAIPS